jgi:hypothetical protein
MKARIPAGFFGGIMSEKYLLLRRISTHLKEQNWFAVIAEFLIVVAGVFLGIQVSNWNAGFQEQRDENLILQRLSEETDDLLLAVANEKAALEERTALMMSAQPVIYSAEPARSLTEDECGAIALSHIYVLGSDELPILNEVLETGRFDRLKDGAIKRKLREYILFRDKVRSRHVERTNELYRLQNLHPDAISIAAVPLEEDYDGEWTWLSAEGYRWQPSCNVSQMRSDQSFLNDLFDNSGRSGSVLRSYEEREAMLLSLKERLDASLGD